MRGAASNTKNRFQIRGVAGNLIKPLYVVPRVWDVVLIPHPRNVSNQGAVSSGGQVQE